MMDSMTWETSRSRLIQYKLQNLKVESVSMQRAADCTSKNGGSRQRGNDVLANRHTTRKASDIAINIGTSLDPDCSAKTSDMYLQKHWICRVLDLF